MFEMHCRENFILITSQFSAGKPARRQLGFSCLHIVSQEIGQLVLGDFQSPGSATQQGLESTSEGWSLLGDFLHFFTSGGAGAWAW